MEDGGWRMEDGGWRMEDGGWRMEDGGWRMEDRGWIRTSARVSNIASLTTMSSRKIATGTLGTGTYLPLLGAIRLITPLTSSRLCYNVQPG
jgi:hypothetical protein